MFVVFYVVFLVHSSFLFSRVLVMSTGFVCYWFSYHDG